MPPSDSVWLRPDRPPRDRQLDRDRIVAVAVALLDAGGHRALSMRRVATELGVTAGSLYWYVRTKDELLELALDHVLGEVTADPAQKDWRRAVGDLARSHRAMLLRHRWVLSELTVRPNLGPNAFALAETGLQLMSRAGFADADLDAALAVVNDHVVGAVLAELAWRDALSDPDATWNEATTAYLREAVSGHPLLAGRMAAATGVDPEQESERRFAFALDCLLDGLADRHPDRRPDRRAEPESAGPK
ncbi:TetR/AcrR family transcriptional regulator [Actinomadura rupiterrae]|uniref:TetR/AcrR family transcriptional regulator n=1 Tax=Actinomadura rupiterrae TaxID=559627 RepID=UPI0020A37E6D|nr:TetR/AcrR family transcriptional regulator [Actinomadura rupiterrae]MCP2340432.1 AcrR family transcriptional regulator [Actinomadura rupiterrae]